MKYIKKKDFDNFTLRTKCLHELDLSKLELISDTALTRIIECSALTLKTFKVSVKN
jgi:hypothetical protein